MAKLEKINTVLPNVSVNKILEIETIQSKTIKFKHKHVLHQFQFWCSEITQKKNIMQVSCFENNSNCSLVISLSTKIQKINAD